MSWELGWNNLVVPVLTMYIWLVFVPLALRHTVSSTKACKYTGTGQRISALMDFVWIP